MPASRKRPTVEPPPRSNPPGRPRRTEHVPKWYAPFLASLALGHTVVVAAKSAGTTVTNCYLARAKDSAFADAWEAALEYGIQVAEEELFTRAVHGVDKPVYFQGILMDTYKEKSDGLLQFYLRAKRPEVYRDNVQLDVNGSLAHEISVLGGKQPIEVDAAQRREAAKLLLSGEVES